MSWMSVGGRAKASQGFSPTGKDLLSTSQKERKKERKAEAGVTGSLLLTVTVPLLFTVTLKPLGRGEELWARIPASRSGTLAIISSWSGWGKGEERGA